MGRELTSPSERLKSAALLAADIVFTGENGKNLKAVDVGCDHAKLAVYLVQSCICSSVLACDINEGPVNKARETVSRRKFHDNTLDKYIKVIKNDGLKGLEKYDFDRVFILGMGGELIADILENAKYLWTTDRKTAFVLQAMTSESKLREFLYINGFCIKKEQLVVDKGRIYSLLLCFYDGKVREADEISYMLGEYNINNKSEIFNDYLERKIIIKESLIKNMINAGIDAENEENLLVKLKELRS